MDKEMCWQPLCWTLFCCARGAGYLHKAVDSHDGHVWLAFGIVHQVQVDQLLQLQVVSLHAVDNVREQRAAQG